MAKNFGGRTRNGVLSTDNPVLTGGWVVTFDPAFIAIQVESEVYHIAVSGPAGSSFEMWLDTTFYSSVSQGRRTDWDPAQPMRVRPGSTIYFYFNSTDTPAPKVSVFFREVTIL